MGYGLLYVTERVMSLIAKQSDNLCGGVVDDCVFNALIGKRDVLYVNREMLLSVGYVLDD